MGCPDELTLMMLLDGELDKTESNALRRHVARCSRCGDVEAMLRWERRVLGDTLREMAVEGVRTTAPEPVGSAATGSRRRPKVAPLGVAVFVVACVAVLMEVAVGWFQVPSAVEWMSPFHRTGQINWLFSGGVYGALESGWLFSTAARIGEATTVLVVLLSVLGMGRGFQRVMVTTLLVGLVVGLSPPVEALEIRRSEEGVLVPVDETIDDTLMLIGDTVTVDGTVTGDLIARGRRVRIRGVVRGNLIVVAQHVNVEGSVGGSVFGFAQTVSVWSGVGGSLYAAGQVVNVMDGSRVNGNAVIGAVNVAIDGVIGRDVRASGGQVDIGGTVERGVTVRGQRVTIAAASRIDGNVTAEVPGVEDAQVETGATVLGATEVRIASEASPMSKYFEGAFYLQQVRRVASAFVGGWLFFWLLPTFWKARFETPAAGLKALGVGSLCVVVTPVGAVIAGSTVIGLPVALVALGMWVLVLYLSKMAIAVYLGHALLGLKRPDALVLAVGLVLVFIVVSLPYVGWIVNLAFTLIGVGMLYTAFANWYRFGSVAVSP